MVLKITDKVKFLLRILSCITVCTHHRNTGGEPVCVWYILYMGGGAGRHGYDLHYIFRHSHGHRQ